MNTQHNPMLSDSVPDAKSGHPITPSVHSEGQAQSDAADHQIDPAIDPAEVKGSDECVICEALYSKASVPPMCKELGICQRCFEANVNMLGAFEDEHVKPYIAPNYVINNIYIGPDNSAIDCDKLKELGITHILVAGSYLQCRFPDKFKYMQLDIDDSLEEDILRVIDRSTEFINSAVTRRNSPQGQSEPRGKILVHCASGVSRSASIVIAYLMRYTSMTNFESAYKFLFEKRSKIHPNTNFVRQLKSYEEMLKKNTRPINRRGPLQ